jgi:hypothetical protein
MLPALSRLKPNNLCVCCATKYILPTALIVIIRAKSMEVAVVGRVTFVGIDSKTLRDITQHACDAKMHPKNNGYFVSFI